MSAATYRINIYRDMAETAWPWKAQVIRLSDESIIAVKIGDSREEVEANARNSVASLALADEPENRPATLYVGDDGQDAA